MLGNIQSNKAKKAVQMARAAGIDTGGYFMVGLSVDTEETMKDTIKFAKTICLF